MCIRDRWYILIWNDCTTHTWFEWTIRQAEFFWLELRSSDGNKRPSRYVGFTVFTSGTTGQYLNNKGVDPTTCFVQYSVVYWNCCPRWKAFERCSQCVWLCFCQVPVGVGESDARDESAPGTDVSPQQPGFGSDRQSACWIGTRGRIRTTKIFVIVKFHVVTKTNTRYSGVINTCINIRSLSLSYIVPSAKRFVRPYSGQPTRKGNSYQVPGMKLILSWRTAYALKCRCSRCPLTLLSLST